MRALSTKSCLSILALLLLCAPLATSCSDDTGTTPLPDTGIPDQGPTPDVVKPDLPPVVHKALTVKVAHVNDTHSQIDPVTVSLTFKNPPGADEKANVLVGGMPRLAAKIKALRTANPNMLFLHGGDVFTGSLYFMKSLGIADAELFNLMKLDAQVLGNHEFDKTSKVLADYAKKATYPLLAANVDVSGDTDLKGLVKPYIIKTIDGEQVGIFGLITPDTTIISSPAATVKFSDAKAAAIATVKELEGKGVNKIILLSHLSYDEDVKLAAMVAGIDVIVGGHSHTLLGDVGFGIAKGPDYPTTAMTAPNGNTVCIVQAWYRTQVLGTLDVALDKDGKITSCTGKPTLLVAGDIAGNIQQQNATTKKYEDVTGTKRTAFLAQLTGTAEQIADDPAAVTALDPYRTAIAALKAQVIATVTEDLWHVRVPGMTHTASGEVLANGSYIAPYVVESYLWKGAALSAKAEIGIVNAGGVRVDIPKGNLTMGQVYELQPFGNTLYILKVTGKELKDALDGAVTLATQATSPSTGAFPYPAGFRYTADITKPVGSRITSMEINKSGTWSAMSDTTTYTLVTLSFVAGGGDGYTTFKNATAYRYETGIVDAETFADWAQNVKKTFARPASTGITYIK